MSKTFLAYSGCGTSRRPLLQYYRGGVVTQSTSRARCSMDEFSDLELRNLRILIVPDQSVIDGTAYYTGTPLLQHAQAVYGPDARRLLPLPPPPESQADSRHLAIEPGLRTSFPRPGRSPAHRRTPTGPAARSTIAAQFHFGEAPCSRTWAPLLNTVPVPFRVVGPAQRPKFLIRRRTSSCRTTAAASTSRARSSTGPAAHGRRWFLRDPSSTAYRSRCGTSFHRFYHPFTRLFWHQLSGSGGFPLFYDRNLQLESQTRLTRAVRMRLQLRRRPTEPVTWDHGVPGSGIATIALGPR